MISLLCTLIFCANEIKEFSPGIWYRNPPLVVGFDSAKAQAEFHMTVLSNYLMGSRGGLTKQSLNGTEYDWQEGIGGFFHHGNNQVSFIRARTMEELRAKWQTTLTYFEQKYTEVQQHVLRPQPTLPVAATTNVLQQVLSKIPADKLKSRAFITRLYNTASDREKQKLTEIFVRTDSRYIKYLVDDFEGFDSITAINESVFRALLGKILAEGRLMVACPEYLTAHYPMLGQLATQRTVVISAIESAIREWYNNPEQLISKLKTVEQQFSQISPQDLEKLKAQELGR